MSHQRAYKRRWIFGTMAALLAAAIAMGAGTALSARVSTPKPPPNTRRAHARKIDVASRFGVLSRAHGANAAVRNGPFAPGAVLANTFGHRSVYLWEAQRNEHMAGSASPLAPEQVVCEGYTDENKPEGAGCAPASLLAESGGVTFGRRREPGTNTLSPMIVTVVVPDGVESVKFTDEGGKSYEVAVKSNVVLVEDEKLARPPATAVSFRLPDGHMRNVPMPEAEAKLSRDGTEEGG